METNSIPYQMDYQEQGSCLPLVLIHGFPLNRTIWDPIVPALAKEARVILPDLRGHGKSRPTGGTYTMPELAEDVVHLLDRLEIERAIIVGHSMGGYISLAFAHAYPDRLLGLGFVSTQAQADTPERRKNRYETVEMVSRSGIGFMAESLPPKYTTDIRYQEAVRRIILNTSIDGVIGALLGMAERVDATPYLSDIHVPVLAIAGDQDEVIPIVKTLDICAHIPQADCVEISGSKHMTMMENPELVAQGLIRLITAVKRIELHSS